MLKSSKILKSTLLMSIVLVGCGQNNRLEGELQRIKGKLFANRPVHKESVFSIIKMRSPGLLATAKRVEGKLVLNDQQKEIVLREQMEMESNLEKLDSRIKVLNRYRLVLNALVVQAPAELEDKLKGISGVTYVEKESLFARPRITQSDSQNNKSLGEVTSVSHIEALRANEELGIKGQGIKVGIIDTGIDFTHKMFGGEGTSDAYKAVDPSKPHTGFPNAKIVGGIDLVGTDYDGSSPISSVRVPKPDENPIDEGGHGTHVAGSVAGIGDGVNTYSGVAPDALLYAIKVFGKDGSTGDGVVIAALEYAADPNGDLDIEDALDVVNLSLGSGYGKPHLLYSEAVKNLSVATVVVASAGNSGHEPYITGAPATSEEAISVAASVDAMDHNYKFDAVLFESLDGQKWTAEMVEGSFTKPLSEMTQMKGKLVFIGKAATDLTADEIQKVKGNIALIERGEVSFLEKVKRAAMAEATAVVVFNNRDGAPFVMGGDENIAIPGIMISQGLGQNILEKMASSDVIVDLKTQLKIEKPELIDTLTSFSSRGPRSMDALLKPEISSPGKDIVSAQMGGGDKGVRMSGTSMAGPHIAGVMALFREKFPEATSNELKSILLGSAKIISDKDKARYPVSMQGAGRVEVYKGLTLPVYSQPASLSLGIQQVGSAKKLYREIEIANMSDTARELGIKTVSSKEIKVQTALTLTVPAGEKVKLPVRFEISNVKDEQFELDGFIEFYQGDLKLLHVPFLVVGRKVSDIKALESAIHASGTADQLGAMVEVELSNTGKNPGKVMAFNLLGLDKRQYRQGDLDATRSTACDLQSAGYRIVEKTNDDGEKQHMLQFAVKTYAPLTRWQGCEISVLFDTNGDGEPEQELGGIIHENLEGFDGNEYSSFLLDFPKARQIRKDFEAARASGDLNAKVDYTQALVDHASMKTFNLSTLAVVEVDISKVAKTSTGEVAVKLVVANEDRAAIEADDYLDAHQNEWKKLQLDQYGPGYAMLNYDIEVLAGSQSTLILTKGQGSDELILYYPNNFSGLSDQLTDNAQEVLNPKFSF